MTQHCNRCSAPVHINASRSRKCKNKIYINICNKTFCYVHAKVLFHKTITHIQSCWRGYKSRKIIINIYKKLPDDIQCKIITYIRLDIYYKKFYKCINNILYKKSFKLLCGLDAFGFNDYTPNEEFSRKLLYNIENCMNTYLLFTKYFPIINDEEKVKMFYLSKKRLYKLRFIIEILNSEENNIYNINICKELYKFDTILTLYNTVYLKELFNSNCVNLSNAHKNFTTFGNHLII